MTDNRIYPIYPIGTQLELNSGSCVLTVVDSNIEKRECTVVWYDDEKNCYEHTYPTICLKPANIDYIKDNDD